MRKKIFGLTSKYGNVQVRICGIKFTFKKKYDVYKIIYKLLFFLTEQQKLYLFSHINSFYKWQYDIKYKKYSYEEIFNLLATYKIFPKNIFSIEETIDALINSDLSFARIGDGEELLDNIIGNNLLSKDLQTRLIDIMASGSNDRCLVGINNFNSDSQEVPLFYRKHFANYWANVVTYSQLAKLNFSKTRMYGDAYSLLFYFKENDNTEIKTYKKERIKKIWENKKVLFIVNEQSQVINDNDCFNNVKERAFIYVPAKAAFLKYDEIYHNVVNNYQQDWLVYIEAGACATVLAYELSALGYRALDFGDYYRRIYDCA